MPIQLECDACGRRIKVKDEYAGRRIRCPGCQEAIMVPSGGDDFDVDFEDDDFEDRPAARSRGKKSVPQKRRSEPIVETERGWFRRNWQWVAVGVVLLFSPWPKVGIVIAGLIAVAGLFLALLGGAVMVVIPFGKVLLGDPKTFLSMLLSPGARIRMMRQPDNHPYKVLMRNAFTPTPGLYWTRRALWKGVLLMVMFFPAYYINKNIPKLFKSHDQLADAPVENQNPHLLRPGRQPVRVPPQDQPNFDPRVGAEQGFGFPGFNPPGIPPRNRTGQNETQPELPPQGTQPSIPGESQRGFLYTITYKSFEGEGSAKDAALSALKIHPDFPEDTLKVDEQTQTIQFQYQTRIDPPALGRLLSQHGFGTLRLSIRQSSP